MREYLLSALIFLTFSCSNETIQLQDKFCEDLTCNHFNGEFQNFNLFNFKIDDREIVYVPDNLVNINNFLKENKQKIIVFERKKYELDPIELNSNQTLIIPEGAFVKLRDDATMPFKGGAFIRAEGSIENRIENTQIIINGIVDANKKIHSYEKSGNEGVTVRFSKNCKVFGTGVIRNSSGDGIDIDDSINLVVEGLKLCSNSGSGIHFGSPRPITPSFNNLIINCKATRNGYLLNRSGMDISWPNDNGATYLNSYSFDNYRNWDISAVGGLLINCFSYGDNVIEENNFSGSDYVFLNGKKIEGTKSLFSDKQKIEFKSFFKKVY